MQTKVPFYAHRDPDFIAQKLGSVLGKCSSWLGDCHFILVRRNLFYLVYQKNFKMVQISTFCVMVMLLKVLTVSNTEESVLTRFSYFKIPL